MVDFCFKLYYKKSNLNFKPYTVFINFDRFDNIFINIIQLPDGRMHALWKIHSELNLCDKIDSLNMARLRQELEDDLLKIDSEDNTFSASAKKEIDLYKKCLHDVSLQF